MRYGYFTSEWPTWRLPRGQYLVDYFAQFNGAIKIPVIELYALFAQPGGGEPETYAKVQTVSTMTTYFTDLKLLFEKAKAFGRRTGSAFSNGRRTAARTPLPPSPPRD
jgi:hypothetical protein